MDYQCLIVDDEKPLADSTAEYFNLFGVTATVAYEEEACLNFLEKNKVDLILLDINLGTTSGFQLCKQLRETMKIPILFISARQSEDDILLALGIGGDDYITKPYSLSILLAKVKAVLKRCSKTEEKEKHYRTGNLRVDFTAGRVYLSEKLIKQKALEYKLLCYLIQNRGRVIPKEELFKNVWEDRFTGDGTLNVHIRKLREQIEEDPNHPKKIQTIWGIGYLFEQE